MDSFLVTVLVVAIAGLSNWLQHRAQGRQERPHTPNPDPAHPLSRPRPPRRTVIHSEPRPPLQSTLERELRRLLGEDVSLEPHPAPPVVPPVAPRLPLPETARTVHEILPSPETQSQAPVNLFRESAAGQSRAQHLGQTMADRLHRVDQGLEKHGTRPPPRSTPPPERVALKSSNLAYLRKDREAARQAFIASLVFGLPKALD